MPEPARELAVFHKSDQSSPQPAYGGAKGGACAKRPDGVAGFATPQHRVQSRAHARPQPERHVTFSLWPRWRELVRHEGHPLNSDQARELAAVLREVAAQLDGWAAK